ncbi:MAG: CpaF family protein [Actinomycetota bacterium]
MDTATISRIESAVRQLVKERGVDPSEDGMPEVAGLVDEVLAQHELTARTTEELPDTTGTLRKLLIDSVAGFGPLQSLFDDPEVEEIWINGPGKVFCARRGQHHLTNIVLEQERIPELVERMLRSSGRRLDLSSPFVDATLPDGSRLHVVIPDITRRHWAVNIRKFIVRAHTLDELVRLGSLDRGCADFLAASVQAGLNIVVSGATQTGKTTLLNCLSAHIPSRERVISCEEVFELQVPLPDVVALQTRQANLEGKGAIDLRRLITEALRMRPDRIIVGEVRQSEALDLLVALNSGLPGMTSLHANNAIEALRKLTTLPLLAGENVTHSFVVPVVASSIDLIVHLRKVGRARRVQEVLGVTGRVEGEAIETVPLFRRGAAGLEWTGYHPPRVELFGDAGIDLKDLLR